jgi:RNA polymerase sigma factor (sigma-70 family)
VAAAVALDEAAAACLYRRFEGLVRYIVWPFAKGNRATAEDLIQDIWTHIFTVALRGWQPAGRSLASFIATTARNKLIDWYRAQGSGRLTDNLDVMLSAGRQFPDVAYTPARLLAIQGVRDCVDQIPDHNRRLALDMVLNGWRYDEIAGALASNKITVGTWIFRAKNEIRPCLERTLPALYLKEVL